MLRHIVTIIDVHARQYPQPHCTFCLVFDGEDLNVASRCHDHRRVLNFCPQANKFRGLKGLGILLPTSLEQLRL